MCCHGCGGVAAPFSIGGLSDRLSSSTEVFEIWAAYYRAIGKPAILDYSRSERGVGRDVSGLFALEGVEGESWDRRGDIARLCDRVQLSSVDGSGCDAISDGGSSVGHARIVGDPVQLGVECRDDGCDDSADSNSGGGGVDNRGDQGHGQKLRPRQGRDVENVEINVGSVFDNVPKQSGPNLERNRENRRLKKLRKQKRQAMNVDWRSGGRHESFFSGCDDAIVKKLKESRAKKFIAENEARAEKFDRELKIMSANDVMEEIRQYRTGVSARTERNMVSIEKTHASLVRNGNVSGTVETVVSSGSISPNSSASMAEFHAQNKALLDAERRLALFEKRFGISAIALEKADKELWTYGSENDAILDELCPDGYGQMDMEDHGFAGKRRIFPV